MSRTKPRRLLRVLTALIPNLDYDEPRLAFDSPRKSPQLKSFLDCQVFSPGHLMPLQAAIYLIFDSLPVQFGHIPFLTTGGNSMMRRTQEGDAGR